MIEAYIRATEDVLRLAGQMFLRRIDYELRRFGEDLLDFIYDLDRHPRRDWRARFDAFLADQTARGRELVPESRAALIAYLELWEQNVFGGPPAPEPPLQAVITRFEEAEAILPEPTGTPEVPSMLAPRKLAGANKPAGWWPFGGDTVDFYRKLNDARGCAGRIEAAKPGVPLEIDDELNAVEALVWRHNDLLESAREIWLRENLGQPEFAELDLGPTPASLGLPLFTDDQQAARAKAQFQKIGLRLKQKIAFLDNVIFAMQAIEWAGTAASFALAGGILYQALKQGGKVLLVKAVAMAASAAAGALVGKATGAVLKEMGVEEETVEKVQNAVELISWLLLLRRMGKIRSRSTRRVTEPPKRAGTPKRPKPPSAPLALPAPRAQRVPQDVNVSPVPPRRLSTRRSIGGSRRQWRSLQADIRRAQAEGARDIRVNQQQVNAAGQRVGVNRPDLQYTRADGTRVYIEYDNATPGSFPDTPRGPAHAARIQANDPSGVIELRRFP